MMYHGGKFDLPTTIYLPALLLDGIDPNPHYRFESGEALTIIALRETRVSRPTSVSYFAKARSGCVLNGVDTQGTAFRWCCLLR